MTVQELINDLSLCNPDLPVLFESDHHYCIGNLVRSAAFRTSEEFIDEPGVFSVGFGKAIPVVLLMRTEPDDDERDE